MSENYLVDALHRMGFYWPDDTHLDQWLDGTMTGWPIVRYQIALAGASQADHLVVDGIAGPKTRLALDTWGDQLAPNFSALEFRCKHCQRNGVRRELVSGLQTLRNRAGKPVRIVSGYRCTAHNAAVGGASKSMHLEGLAADITPALPQKLVRGIRSFSGLGLVGRGSQVRHVDARHALKGATATPTNPSTWRY